MYIYAYVNVHICTLAYRGSHKFGFPPVRVKSECTEVHVYISTTAPCAQVGCLLHFLFSLFPFFLFLSFSKGTPPPWASPDRSSSQTPPQLFGHHFFVILLMGFFTDSWSNLATTWPQLGLQNRSNRGPGAFKNAFKFAS